MDDNDNLECEVFDEGYNTTPVTLQLMKLLDSEGNKVEIHSIVTDEGIETEITFDQARKILAIMNAISVKERKQYLDSIQTIAGLQQILINLDRLFALAQKAGNYESNYEGRLYEARG